MFLSATAKRAALGWANVRKSHRCCPSKYFRHNYRLFSLSSSEEASALDKFRTIVGIDNVLDGHKETTQTAGFLKGARLGRGTALAICRPTKVSQVPLLLQTAVDSGCVVVVQGANTGLTGASVPRSGETERPTVIINTRHLDSIWPVDDGTKVLCMAGVGLASLQTFVASEVPGRQSHSVLGSTFLNPTTAAGVAFGSGGTQIRKGPSTTERALYLKVDEDSTGNPTVRVVNTLGIEGLDAREGEFAYTKEEGKTLKNDVLGTLDSLVNGVGVKSPTLKSNATYGTHVSHDDEYKTEVCSFDEKLTRFNADTKGLDCNRSEGKVLILATVHDTFAEPDTSQSYWISFHDMETTMRFKTDVALVNPHDLPESIEYMDRGCFEVIDRAGRFMGHFIKYFGTTSPLVSKGWDFKLKIQALPGMSTLPDQVQYRLNNLLPPVLPPAIMDLGNNPDRHHHLAITVGNYIDDEDDSLAAFKARLAKFREDHPGKVDVHQLISKSEKAAVNAFRYVAAAAFPTYCVGNRLQGISVDYALPKNSSEPPPLDDDSPQPTQRMRYSHFGCNVVHEDLAYESGVDTHAAKMALKHVVDEVCHGRLPSEHGHGTEYHAPEDTQKRWRKMDPLNVMNPGVGGMSTKLRYE